MKLHLGCGNVYLDGYINIDFPSYEHTVQEKTKVDQYLDLRSLKYEAKTIEEIRLHHVFEHFSRTTSLALLAGWWTWLKVEGLLRMEVPDFQRTAWAVLNPISSKKAQFIGLRHIFGSQEAPWAVHMEGWTTKNICRVLDTFGYKVEEVRRNNWHGTYNIEIFARKMPLDQSFEDLEKVARVWLSQYTVDNGESEKKMLEEWMTQYQTQIRIMQI